MGIDHSVWLHSVCCTDSCNYAASDSLEQSSAMKGWEPSNISLALHSPLIFHINHDHTFLFVYFPHGPFYIITAFQPVLAVLLMTHREKLKVWA
jgi:hypothetical protein